MSGSVHSRSIIHSRRLHHTHNLEKEASMRALLLPVSTKKQFTDHDVFDCIWTARERQRGKRVKQFRQSLAGS